VTLHSPNVLEGEFYELRVGRVLRSSLRDQTNPYWAALKNTMADAPTTTKTKTTIKMAGTTSALPVVVACISRIPTVAKRVGTRRRSTR
jgi:hypothetical protein